MQSRDEFRKTKRSSGDTYLLGQHEDHKIKEIDVWKCDLIAKGAT